MTKLEQVILWRRLDQPGHDACALWSSESGWLLRGTAVFRVNHRPCHLQYEVDCDESWRTRRASVQGWLGVGPVALTIVRGPHDAWTLNDAVQPQVAGCFDVDLSFTPATNLTQIRRLNLQVGQEADAPAAWLTFPEFVLERLDQHYRRIGPHAYAYQAPSIGYADTLEVVESGFVTRYPGLWEAER